MTDKEKELYRKIFEFLDKYETLLLTTEIFREPENNDDIIYQQYLFGKKCAYEEIIKDLYELESELKK